MDASGVATAADGTLAIPLPSFQRDIALKIRPGGPAPSEVLPPGGTLTSDDAGDGPDASHPVSTTITTPVGGLVSIGSSTSTDPPATGYGLVGVAIDIAAPPASAANPLVLVFRIDASVIPVGDSAGTVKLFRNGVIVGECTGAPGVAAPDPCVATRQTLMDGDIQLTARTSSASIWSAGVPAPRLGTITVPAPVKAVGVVMTASATLTDSGALGGHVAVWNWGDGTTSAGTIPSGATGSAVVSGNHAFATPGIRTVTLTVTDPSGQRAVTTFDSVVTYAATSVATGSGTILPGGATSLPGDTLPGLNGRAKASIAIDLKYKKGATIPTGSATMVYSQGNFKFTASTIDWLVVSSPSQASIGGHATIGGRNGSHPFRLAIVDGDRLIPKSADSWVLRVWSPGADIRTAAPLFQASGTVTGQVAVSR